MLPPFRILATSLLFAAALACAAKFNIGKGAVKDLYTTFCSACHGVNLEGGGQGPSLLDDTWLHGDTDDEIARNIAEGVPNTLMIPWKYALTAEQIRSLVIFIREQRRLTVPPPPDNRPAPTEVTFAGGNHRFRLEEIFRGASVHPQPDATLWGFVFEPDGSLLATQRDGVLWQVTPSGEAHAIADIPAVWRPGGEGGLFDVTLDLNYGTNGWMYLSYSEPGESTGEGSAETGMTVVARGRISDGTWQNQQILFRAPQDLYTPRIHHFGSRLLLRDEHLFFTVGDHGDQEASQDLASPLGKIHRVHLDGSIPKDNPFVDRAGAWPSIWTLGNRNAQGLALQPGTGALWASEHGPRGGDEINLILPGANYGWPVVTHGINYDGSPITHLTTLSGMEDPKHQWTPSIATAGIAFYDGDQFPNWQGHLLVGGMWGEELHLLHIEGDEVTTDEVLIKDRGRVRHVVIGPDGHPYISLTNGNPRVSVIYRLVPTN